LAGRGGGGGRQPGLPVAGEALAVASPLWRGLVAYPQGWGLVFGRGRNAVVVVRGLRVPTAVAATVSAVLDEFQYNVELVDGCDGADNDAIGHGQLDGGEAECVRDELHGGQSRIDVVCMARDLHAGRQRIGVHHVGDRTIGRGDRYGQDVIVAIQDFVVRQRTDGAVWCRSRAGGYARDGGGVVGVREGKRQIRVADQTVAADDERSEETSKDADDCEDKQIARLFVHDQPPKFWLRKSCNLTPARMPDRGSPAAGALP